MTITRRHRNERIAAATVIAILTIVLVVFIRWNQAEEESLRRDQRYIPRKETITPEILLLRDYVRIDTSTPEGAANGARWLAARLSERGIRAELIESTPGRLNVYARIRGKRRGAGLLLHNHIDVVGVNPAEWTYPPFGGEIRANRMWGRGTIDMKAMAVCELLALAAVQREGLPESDVAFLATAEEEQGSGNGMKWLLEHRPDLFDGIEYAISEGGITEVISETMTYFGVEVGSKQHVQTILRAPDKATLLAARIALEPYMTSRERARVLPEVRRFFADIAPTRIRFKPILSDIDGAIAGGRAWVLPLPYRELMQNSIRVTTPVASGTEWSMNAVLLNLPDQIPEDRVAWLKSFVAPYGISVTVVTKEGPVPTSRIDTPLAATLISVARSFYGVRAGSEVLYSSVSDCRFLRVRGIQCYGVCPYLVDINQSQRIHRADENIRLDWYMGGIDYFRLAVTRWTKRR